MNEVTRATPAQGFGDALMRVLTDPQIPADKLQIVLQVQERLVAEQRREAFQAAFVAMAARMPQVNKNGTVELVKEGRKIGAYKFAKWEDMDVVLRPILAEFGFALTFAETPTKNGGSIQLRGELMHLAGHSISSERSMPPDTGPGRNALQAQGSAISYAKRYLAEELCNIVRKGQDDDGLSATSKPITADQAKELRELLKAIKTKPETFLRLFVTGCDSVEEIQTRDFPRLVNALKEKQRSMEEK